MNFDLRSRSLGYLFLLLVLGCSGCFYPTPAPISTVISSATSSPTITPIVESTATLTPVSSLTPFSVMIHDLDVRTGIEEVDRIINIVLDGDVNQLRDVLAFTAVECTHEDGLGGPPKCRDEVSEGTEVEVLPFLGPEGHFLRKDEVHEWSGIEVLGLYAVYRVSDEVYSTEYYPAGQIGVIFIGPREKQSVVLQIDDGRVVRIDYVLGDSPKSKLEREAQDIILPPPSNG